MVFGRSSKQVPAHEQQPEPYAGIDPDTGRPASTGPHSLVIGGTGSGKSRRVLAPAIRLWEGPVLSVSSKPDIAELTIRQRARHGPVYLLDLTGQVRESELLGVDVTRVSSDPCVLIENDDDALKMASLLMTVGGLGVGDGTSSSGGDSFWQTLAVAPLAALLRAGGMLPDPETGKPVFGGGIEWVLRAAIRTEAEDSDDNGDEENVDWNTPSWDSAVLRSCALLQSRHADHLKAAKALDPKQRDSIGINARVALAPWMMQATLGGEDAVPFRPEMLHHPGATLYLVAPGDGAAAGAAVAVVEQVIRHWRQRLGQIPRVLLSVDEFTNTMPLPGASAIQYVTEGRGLGLNIQIALQISDQFELRYGSAGMNVLRKVFPSTLILVGAPEKDMCELAAWQEGEGERQTTSVDATGGKSHSAQSVQTVQGAKLLPTHRGEGRLLKVTRKGVKVRLPDIDAIDWQEGR